MLYFSIYRMCIYFMKKKLLIEFGSSIPSLGIAICFQVYGRTIKNMILCYTQNLENMYMVVILIVNRTK